MTSTQESGRPVLLIGQSVGQAQASLTRLLIGILAETGTPYQTYLGLQRLTALGGQATRSRRRCACSTGPSGSPASTRPRAGSAETTGWPPETATM